MTYNFALSVISFPGDVWIGLTLLGLAASGVFAEKAAVKSDEAGKALSHVDREEKEKDKNLGLASVGVFAEKLLLNLFRLGKPHPMVI